MRQAQTAPDIVELDLDGFVLVVYVTGQELLDALVFGERDMRAEVEQKPRARIFERRRVTAEVGVLVEKYGPDALALQARGRSEARHTGSNDDDVGHCQAPPSASLVTMSLSPRDARGALCSARQPSRLGSDSRPALQLLRPECVAESRCGHTHVFEGNDFVLSDVAQDRALVRKCDR